MRLNSIYISNYKNFNDFRFNHFDEKSENPLTILIGQNGTGKSNLLEVLVKIFKSVDLNEKPPFDFELTYFINSILISITGKSNKKSKFFSFQIGEEEIKSELFSTDEYLPKHVFAYYSGDTKRLAFEFIDSQRKFEKDLFDGNNQTDLRRLFLAELEHVPLILMTLFLFKEEVGKKLLNQINAEKLKEIRIHFNRNPRWYSFDRVEQGNEKFYGAVGIVGDFLSILEEVDIGRNKTEKRQGKNKKGEQIEYNFYSNLIIQGIDFELLKNRFKEPIDFFKFLVATYDSDMIEKIDILFEHSTKKVDIEYKHLSEGEKQLILVLGLIELVNKNNALFLLDEPETHLNPHWKFEYYEYLVNHIGKRNFKNVQILLATHDPQLVQAGNHSNIIAFRDNHGKIMFDYMHPDIGGWRVDQILVSELFGLKSSRSKEINTVTSKIKSIVSKGKLSKEDRVELESLKNEVGFLPTGETVEEIEDRALIRNIANNLRKKK